MNKKEANGVEALLVFLLIPLVVVLDGFVVVKLWSWHVMPTFHLPAVTMGHAIGITCLFNLMRVSFSHPENDSSATKRSLLSLFYALLCLLIGWLAL